MNAIDKGIEAQRILDSEVFSEAMEKARSLIIDEWEHASSTEARERLWHSLKNVDRVRIGLQSIAGDGTMEQSRI